MENTSTKTESLSLGTGQGVYVVAFNNSAADKEMMNQSEYVYPSNYVRTTKYTLYSFVPVNLFHQFRRFYNIYFLIAAALSLVPYVSAISPVTQILPLVFVLVVTMIKDGIEDWYRYKSDKIANNMKYSRVTDGGKEEILSKNIMAGDIIYVKKGEQFPCDLLLLSSSNAESVCFIETSQLDGETNLKRRYAVSDFNNVCTDTEIEKFQGRLECEMPNNRLHSFTGRVTLRKGPDFNEEKITPVSLQNLLLRGAQLRNTDYIYGLAVYAGVDTKIYRNLKNSRLKFSTTESKLNKLLMGIFVYNIVIFLVSVLGSYLWSREYWNQDSWYLWDGTSYSQLVGLQSMTYYILYTYTIPISLFITLEIVRFCQAMFIWWDEELTTEQVDGRIVQTEARNSNLNEDLGQIEYIFSDKTGTLTQNVMKLARWYSANMLFDEFEDSGSLGRAIEQFQVSEGKAKLLTMFARCVSICHTAIASYDADKKEYDYEVESPDELALLESIRNNGFLLVDRGKHYVKIKVFESREEIYEVLDIIEFTSDRRRMSVIVKTADGIHLYCKGADQMIFQRASKSEDPENLEKMKSAIYQFSCEGLRTLVFAWTPVSEAAYENYRQRMNEARAALVGRTEKMSAAADLLEADLYVLGCSAIDDKLQDQVPETIEYLLNCGIKLWVLTGDKRETAINIAKSCRLIAPDTKVFKLEATSPEDCQKSMGQIKREIESLNRDDKNCLVITGEVLIFALADDLSDEFLAIAARCHSVVCCRVSPIQKASVVKLVKSKKKKIVLSVGDGANDVSMIQAANIGVGIVGMEGAQAVRSSDYSIGQFKCLKRLITIHGRYNNVRITKLIYFSLYKNIAFITVCLWFGIYSGWSGWQIYQENFLAMFNVIFTSLPPVALGVFERDVPMDRIDKYPSIYKTAANRNFFSFKNIFYYIILAVWHSLVIFFGLYFVFGDGILSAQGFMSGYWMMAWFASTCVMIIVMLKLILHLRWWPLITLMTILLSILMYVAFMFLCYPMGLFTEYGSAVQVHTLASYYLYAVIVSAISLLPDVVCMFCVTNLSPTDCDILREESHNKTAGECVSSPTISI